MATIDDGSCFAVEAPAPQSAIQSLDPVTFTAEPNSYWYATDDAVDALTVAVSYTFPLLLESDSSVWVAHSNAEFNATGGKAAPDFGAGQFHPNNAYWMLFDVYQDVLFESVEVYSEDGGNHTVEILDAAGSLVASVTQALNAGQNVFSLNVEIPAGEGYQIRSGTNSPFLWRDDDNAAVTYPYDIGSLATITGTTIQGQNQYTYYYFYYNWTMSSSNPCLSDRVEFTVTVEEVNGLGELLPTTTPRHLVKTVDLMGREVANPLNQLVFLVYSDGSVEKRFVTEVR